VQEAVAALERALGPRRRLRLTPPVSGELFV
jgi:hypothetical protein